MRGGEAALRGREVAMRGGEVALRGGEAALRGGRLQLGVGSRKLYLPRGEGMLQVMPPVLDNVFANQLIEMHANAKAYRIGGMSLHRLLLLNMTQLDTPVLNPIPY